MHGPARMTILGQRKAAVFAPNWPRQPRLTANALVLPHAAYRPGQTVRADCRRWTVEAVAQSGREVTIATTTAPFRRERALVAQE